MIVGRNNTGKSNLFDALRLLSNIAQIPIATAFKPERHRGDPIESFFDENRPCLSLACEFDLTGTPLPFFPDRQLPNPLLSYEVEIAFGNGMLSVVAEKLRGCTPAGKKYRSFISMDKDP